MIIKPIYLPIPSEQGDRIKESQMPDMPERLDSSTIGPETGNGGL
jgi:hypothetical protein